MKTRLLLRNLNTFPDVDRKLRGLCRLLLIGFIGACCALTARAIDSHRLLSQYMRDHWGSEKGFTGGTVTAIAQTADGYLWIGTERGLIRFDGLSFHAFQQAVPTTFPIGAVQQLVADSQGDLWILLQSTKVLRYHNGRFELGREEAEFGITSITKRMDGSILLSSLALGPLTYHQEKFEILDPAAATANSSSIPGADELSTRLSWATGVTPHRFAEPNSAVISMAQSPDGKLWLGTRDKGLFYMLGGKVYSAGKTPLLRPINCILTVSDRELWIGTDRGVLRWDGAEITAEGVPPSLAHLSVRAMIRDRDLNIWIGTDSGLVRVNTEGVLLDPQVSRANTAVTALFEDREGNIWIGSGRGIDRLRDSAFVTYSVGGLQTESGGPVYVDEHERVWFAPYEGGLQWLAAGKSGHLASEGLAQDVVYSITGAKNELWLGRQRGGLTHLTFSPGVTSARTYTQADGLAQDGVYAVYQSRNGTVWAGTLSGGVSALKNGRFTTYTTAQGMSSNTIVAIAEDAKGRMWFATPNGIDFLDEGRLSVVGKGDGLPSDSVNCLLSDPSDILWIGTSAGLAYLRSGHVQNASRTSPLLAEQILGIAEDRNGWMWISTSNHVLRLKRDKVLDGSLQESDIREYGMEDGLVGMEGVKRFQSVFTDVNGRVWFSMNRGISVVDAGRATSSSAPALLHINEVTVDGNPVTVGDSLRLSGPHRRIIFNFAAITLSIPERVQYKYKLENFDEDWSKAVAVPEVTYNNLNSGHYQFRLMATNSEGVWNSTELDLPVEITPRYWQTWWFRTGAGILGFLAVFLVYRLRIRTVAAQMNMRFEERLAERTRIAQELHDTLLQGFLSASMQLHVADTHLPLDSEAKPLVERALLLMTRVIDEGRNTVRGLRSTDVSDQNLEQAFSRLQQELAPTSDTGFRVIVEGTPRQLRAVTRDDIYHIGREALANAFRHSRATEIVVEIEYTEKFLRVMVRDNGIGINADVLREGREGHWGLSGMRERAERIGARLRVLSRSAAGTEMELSIPGRIAFSSQSSKDRKSWFFDLFSKKSRRKSSVSKGEQFQ
ncbi:MAG: two-component regulator propeller domain-containing protein [Candidatus Acidiferrum sp.]